MYSDKPNGRSFRFPNQKEFTRQHDTHMSQFSDSPSLSFTSLFSRFPVSFPLSRIAPHILHLHSSHRRPCRIPLNRTPRRFPFQRQLLQAPLRISSLKRHSENWISPCRHCLQAFAEKIPVLWTLRACLWNCSRWLMTIRAAILV